MFRRQKESILGLLKERDALKDYGKKNYWLTYRDFLDTSDDFTDFAGENLEGKQGYCVNDNGGVTYFPRQYFLIGDDGDLIPVENPCDSGYHMYYCWWD